MPSSNAESEHSTRAGGIWLICLGGSLALAGGVFTWVLWMAYQRAEESRGWMEVPAVIVRSGVKSERPSPNSNLTHRVDVAFRFVVDGVEHTGTRVKRVDIPTTHLERAQERVAAYPVGRALVCHVPPGRPEEAILKHGTRAPLYSIWFPLLFVIGGGGMAVKAWRRLAWGSS